ncbi:MAG TPA: hypothetical protein VNF74_07855 [Terriglobales bacterium]|nr:hypothetical protein [Terriglobales bacterium]
MAEYLEQQFGAGLAIGYLLHIGGVPAVAVFIGAAMVVLTVSLATPGPSARQMTLERINR